MAHSFKMVVQYDRYRFRKFLPLGILSLIGAIGCIAWSFIFFEDYSRISISSGFNVSLEGPAIIVMNIGFGCLGFAALWLLYQLVRADWKYPAIGLNAKAIMLNKGRIRRSYFKWEEIESMESANSDLAIRLKDPTTWVNKQGATIKELLREKYVKQNEPFLLSQIAPKSRLTAIIPPTIAQFEHSRKISQPA